MKIIEQGHWKRQCSCWQCKSVLEVEERDLYPDLATFKPHQIYTRCISCGQSIRMTDFVPPVIAARVREAAEGAATR